MWHHLNHLVYIVILIPWTPKYVCWSLIGCFSNNLIMSQLYITTYKSSYVDCNLISWSPKSVHRWFDIWYLELVYPLLERSIFYNILIWVLLIAILTFWKFRGPFLVSFLYLKFSTLFLKSECPLLGVLFSITLWFECYLLLFWLFETFGGIF